MDDRSLMDLPLWNDSETNQLLQNMCAEEKVPMDVLQELIGLQREYQHMQRARGIYDDIDSILARLEG